MSSPGNDNFFSLLPSRDSGLALQMTERILRGMIRSGVWDAHQACVLGCDCSPLLNEANATSPAHDALAIEVAADSAVLLKNEGDLLPLRPGTTVALVGRGCAEPHQLDPTAWWQASDYYVVGGSGRVITTPDRAPSIVQALARRGVLRLRVSPDDTLAGALEAADGADLVLACAGATATEAVDRASLALDQQELLMQLGAALRLADIPLVVLAMAPGQIEAPWANSTSAAMVMFLGGQGTGEAWARLLLGEVVPSGKLPVTLPVHEGDMRAPCEETSCVYRDGLHFGWTAMIDKPVAFPFGHGLSYSQFRYEWAEGMKPRYSDDVSSNRSTVAPLSVTVSNTGHVPARETVQLYLSFPATSALAASEPRMLLRAFAKTPIVQPGASYTVAMQLSSRDLSVWDSSARPGGGWVVVTGNYNVTIGSSSRDLRLQTPLFVAA